MSATQFDPELPSGKVVIPETAFPTRQTRSSRPRLPVVSVCIVNWNCRDILRKCLLSLKQKRQDIRMEVIVVDNGSTDGAGEMIRTDFPKVHLIQNPTNAGFAKANNQALAIASGKYIFFLNNDTIVPRLTLKKLVRFARKNPDAGIIGPRLVNIKGKTQTSCRQVPTLASILHRTVLFRWTGLFRKAYRSFRFRDQDFTSPKPVQVLMGAALLVPRQLLWEKGAWDESYQFGGEDIELCTRLGETSQIIYNPLISIRHLGRVSSRQRSGYVYTNWLLGMVRFMEKSGIQKEKIWLIKLVLTLDTPLQILFHSIQGLRRIILAKKKQASRNWLYVKANFHMLVKGIPSLWFASCRKLP